MASPAMPIINPFDTKEADKKYEELYEQGTALRVSNLKFFELDVVSFKLSHFINYSAIKR